VRANLKDGEGGSLTLTLAPLTKPHSRCVGQKENVLAVDFQFQEFQSELPSPPADFDHLVHRTREQHLLASGAES
jgi:hypothetical protein